MIETILLGAMMVLSGCERSCSWDGLFDEMVCDEFCLWLFNEFDVLWLTDGGIGSDAGGDDGGVRVIPSSVGGFWVSCYGNFHLIDHLVCDVM